MSEKIFHLAFPVDDLQKAKKFYTLLGAKIGRESNYSFIMDFFGSQLVAHLSDRQKQTGVYPRHFGLILTSKSGWNKIVDNAAKYNLPIYQQAKLRFPGDIAEHNTIFFQDPAGNMIEFKHYTHEYAIFNEEAFAHVGERST